MEVEQQIKTFQEFIEHNYYPQLLEAVRKGNNFLVLDFSELIKFNTEITEEILERPEELLKAAELAVKEFDLPKKVTKFSIRLRNLPESQKVQISEIRSKHLGKLLWAEGIVRQKSDVRPHVTSAKFECPSCGNILTVLQLDKKYKEPSRCSCGRKGKFKEISKELVDGQGLVLEESPDDLDSAQPKRINVFLKDDLVTPISERRCSPGSRVKLCGWVAEVPIILRTGGLSTKYDLILEANMIEPKDEDFFDIKISDPEMEEIKKIAKNPDVLTLLSKNIAPSIYGHDKVKEALVLQLAGGSRKVRPDGVITRGDMHMLLIGDPGSGKCLHPETRIVLSDGSIKTIKETVEKNLDKEPLETPAAIFNVAALNEKGISEQKPVTKLWKRPSPAFLLKIKTQSGNEIIVTENHPFFVTANSVVFSKQAHELTTENHIATPRRIRIENPIQPLPQCFKLSPAHNKRKHVFPRFCDEEIARFFGYLVGDGYVAFSQTSGWISLTNNDKSLLIDFEKILDQRFGAKATRRTSHTGKSALESYLLSIELVRWLESVESTFLQKSAGKRIPEVINKSPNFVLKEFLRALFECEGSVNCNKSAIEISSASKNLISDLKIALLRFEIVSFQARKEKYAANTVLKQRRPYYELQIYGEQAATFAREIGFMSARKTELLLKAITKKHNTNTDVIPQVGKLLKILRTNNLLLQRELGLPRGTYLHYELGDRQPSRDSLQKIVAVLKEKIRESTLALSLLEEISHADIFWDKIKHIEKVVSDVPFVYDLQVEEVHNYLANSIIVHNSQLLKRISKVAPKSRFTSGKGATAAGLTASVVKDEFLGGWSLEAGTLVLANQGFAIIDEMDKMNKEDRSALHEALEQQTISISKANIQATLRCETTVLAAANPKFGRFDPYDLIANQIDLPPTLINRFDLIFPIKDLPNREKDELTATFILNLHKDSSAAISELSTDLLKKYFSYLRQKVHPKMTDAAIEELKAYYVAMRNSGNGEEKGIKSIPITARQLEALVRLSEASAKLRLAKTVSKKDAQKAIEMIDYCLNQIAKDNETGKIDIDRLGGRITATQRSSIGMIKEIIGVLEEQLHEKIIPVEEVARAAQEKNISPEQVEEVLEKLRRSGDIFEPRRGFVQKL